METSNVLTIKQASQVLGVSVNKVYQYINKGVLNAERALEKRVVYKEQVYKLKEFEHKTNLKWVLATRYAKLKKIHRNTVTNWIDAGILDSAVKDGRIYVRRDQGRRKPNIREIHNERD